MAVDALQDLLDLLSTNWNSANTDSKTPLFKKITDEKMVDHNRSLDWVIAHRSRPQQETAGLGAKAKHKHWFIDLDVRTLGKGQEDHWLNVLGEVDRILDANIVLPNANFTIADPDNERQDLSDKRFDSWRYLITVKLSTYAITR